MEEANASQMPEHAGDISAPNGPSIFHGAQIVNVHGGNFHAGNVQYQQVQVSEADILSMMKDVPNYRDIHSANLGKATAGTGPKFAQWVEHCEWLAAQGGLKAMWGTGMPGAGKTIFSAIVINEVDAHAKASESPVCVGYIYFRYSDHTKATTRDCLEVLVKQTIERHPECLSISLKVYTRHVREKTRPSEGELLQLLRQFAGTMLATFYFLDAMDEAPPDVQVDLLEKLSSLDVQLFITSRPMDSLQARFPAAHRYLIRAQDHDLDLHISKEISRSAFLQDILNSRGPELRKKITTKVKEKCGGMFLHASLQLDALRQCTSVHGLEKVLDSFPPRIEDVYQQTWERICDQAPENALIGKNVLSWVLCAERSFTINELRSFSSAYPETHNIDANRMPDERILMDLCRGLVAVEEGTKIVRFVHYTAKDVVKELVSKTNPQPHSIPTRVCLELLITHGLQQSTINSDSALHHAMRGQPLLKYAYKAWSFHAKQSLGDAAAAARLAEFIQGCSSFPVYREHPNPPREGWDRFQPLHMISYFDLPLSLAGSAALREPNVPSSRGGFTPLMLAVMRNSIRRVEELLTQPHIHVNSTAIHGVTALLLASATANSEDAIRLLLNHPQIKPNQAATQRGKPPLILVSQFGFEGAARLLLAHPKTNVNKADGYGQTALMHASFCPEIVEQLLAHPGIKVNAVDGEGRSALMLAAEEGKKRIVKHLLDHPHIDVNLVDKQGKSVFDYDLLQDIAQLLISHSQTRGRSSGVATRINRVFDRASLFAHKLVGR